MNELVFKKKIGHFVNHLRHNGHVIGIKELTDCIDSIADLDQPDKEMSRHYLRTICCRNKNEWQSFDEHFDNFWHPSDINHEADNPLSPKSASIKETQTGISGIAGASGDEINPMSGYDQGGAGKQNTITKTDFRFLNDAHAMREAENLAEKLAIHLKARTRKHKKISLKGSNLDVRHTLRKNISHGGIPIHRAFSVKIRKPPHLVILHDVSHSMSWNNPLLFRFARGLVKACKDSEAFVFHTKLYYVTDVYRAKSIKQMRDKLESKNNLWLGGTCIADSFRQFNQEFAKRVLRYDSTIVIISDGFDTDKPEKLAEQLRKLKSRSKQILWLNPMLNRESHSLDSEEVEIIRPYVDHFLPAHSVDALRNVIYKIKI